MSNRNMLFNTLVQLLKEDGHSLNDSVNIAYSSLTEKRQFKPFFGPQEEVTGSKGQFFRTAGGQSRYTPTVPIIESICKGEPLNCANEKLNPFRRINGTCNNVGGTYAKGAERLIINFSVLVTNN